MSELPFSDNMVLSAAWTRPWPVPRRPRDAWGRRRHRLGERQRAHERAVRRVGGHDGGATQDVIDLPEAGKAELDAAGPL